MSVTVQQVISREGTEQIRMSLIKERARGQERMRYRMKRKKVMAILMAGTMVFSCVGCGSTTKAEESDSTITGKVTEISDTSVTIQLGELMQGGGPNGEKPDGEAPDGEKPEKPEGETSGEEAPDGENPPQGGGVPFEASDETKTIDLKDVEIVEESGQETESVSFEEIEVDDILVIELGDDGTVESVTIKSGRMGAPEPQEDLAVPARRRRALKMIRLRTMQK